MHLILFLLFFCSLCLLCFSIYFCSFLPPFLDVLSFLSFSCPLESGLWSLRLPRFPFLFSLSFLHFCIPFFFSPLYFLAMICFLFFSSGFKDQDFMKANQSTLQSKIWSLHVLSPLRFSFPFLVFVSCLFCFFLSFLQVSRIRTLRMPINRLCGRGFDLSVSFFFSLYFLF